MIRYQLIPDELRKKIEKKYFCNSCGITSKNFNLPASSVITFEMSDIDITISSISYVRFHCPYCNKEATYYLSNKDTLGKIIDNNLLYKRKIKLLNINNLDNTNKNVKFNKFNIRKLIPYLKISTLAFLSILVVSWIIIIAIVINNG